MRVMPGKYPDYIGPNFIDNTKEFRPNKWNNFPPRPWGITFNQASDLTQALLGKASSVYVYTCDICPYHKANHTVVQFKVNTYYEVTIDVSHISYIGWLIVLQHGAWLNVFVKYILDFPFLDVFFHL